MRHTSTLQPDIQAAVADPAGYIVILTHSQRPDTVKISWQQPPPSQSVHFLDDPRGITARPMELRCYGGYPHAKQTFERLQSRLQAFHTDNGDYRIPLQDAVLELAALSAPGALRLLPLDAGLATKMKPGRTPLAPAASGAQTAFGATASASTAADRRQPKTERRQNLRRIEDRMPLIGLISWLFGFGVIEGWIAVRYAFATEPMVTGIAVAGPLACAVSMVTTRAVRRWRLHRLRREQDMELARVRGAAITQ